MSADTVEPLTKVDSAISGLSSSPPDDKGIVKGHRRASSSAAGVYNINDLEKEGKEIQIAPETQKLNWRLNKSPATVDEPAVLKKMLTEPPVKKIDLHFPLGLEVTARNLKGVTIKDALDAIHKQFKKKNLYAFYYFSFSLGAVTDGRAVKLKRGDYQADDELELPVLAGFEWDKEESWTRLIVHQKKEGQTMSTKKKGKKGKEGEEE